MVVKLPDSLEQALKAVAERLEIRMAELLQDPEEGESTVVTMSGGVQAANGNTSVEGEEKVLRAMRYSSLSGGKRLRPFLAVSSAGLFGVSWDSAVNAACAIEFIHTYSLIHDDLPSMDNDDMRRGKPSCHKVFGEAAALLAGDGLLAFAFQVVSDPKVHPDPNVRCELVRSLAIASGCFGMVGGQMMDLEAENKKLSVEEIIRLQRMKTGELFAVSCETGAILGKAPGMMRQVLRAYAHDLGLAFQITDDLLDVLGNRKDTGKAVNKDRQKGKATLVASMGVDRAREHAQTLARQAIGHLNVFDKRADNLRKLAEFVISRKF